MSEFIMTMDEASDYASSSSEDEAAIAFEWTVRSPMSEKALMCALSNSCHRSHI